MLCPASNEGLQHTGVHQQNVASNHRQWLFPFSWHLRDSRRGQPRWLRSGAPTLWGELREVGLFSLEKRELWGDLVVAFLYLWRSYWDGRARFFADVHGGRIRDNGHKIQRGRFRLDISKKISWWGQWRMEQFAQRDFEISVLGSFQDRTGLSCEQPGLHSVLPCFQQKLDYRSPKSWFLIL